MVGTGGGVQGLSHLLVTLVCCHLYVPAAALNCFSCGANSTKGDCEGFVPSGGWAEQCPPAHRVCLVTRGQFEDVVVERRGCGGAAPAPPGCRARRLGGGASASICACTTDLCNILPAAAASLSSSATLALAAVLLKLIN